MTNKLSGYGSTEEKKGVIVRRKVEYSEETELWTCTGIIENTQMKFQSLDRQVAIDKLNDWLMKMQWDGLEPGPL
jgi:hypothetical protein